MSLQLATVLMLACCFVALGFCVVLLREIVDCLWAMRLLLGLQGHDSAGMADALRAIWAKVRAP